MRQRLSAAQVAELAELIDDALRRTGVVGQALQAAEGRGMTLMLADRPGGHRGRRGEPANTCGRRAEGGASVTSRWRQ
jgi:hypothetical protein